MKITITNVVVTSSSNFQINLHKFSELNGFNIDEAYPVGVHCRRNKIKGLVTVFKSGKMISVGTNTIKAAVLNLKFIQRLLKKQRKLVEIKP